MKVLSSLSSGGLSSKKTEHGNDREASLAQRDTVSQTTSRRHAARTLSSSYCSAPRIRTLFSWLSVSLCHCTKELLRLSDDRSRLTVNTGRWHGRNCLKERLPLPGVFMDNKVFPCSWQCSLRLLTLHRPSEALPLNGSDRVTWARNTHTGMALYLCSCSLRPHLPQRVRTWNIIGFTAKCLRCASTASVKCFFFLWHDFSQRECVDKCL